MSSSGRSTGKTRRRKAVRKPPPHWRKYLTQAELELPPPAGGAAASDTDDTRDEFEDDEGPALAWWQTQPVVASLVVACIALLVLAIASLLSASRERAAARVAAEREQVLTLRAINSVRTLRIAPNPRSWSAAPDLTLAWPEPPQLLELHLAMGYSPFLAFAVIVDKVDHGCRSTARPSGPANTACACRATRGAASASTWAGCGCASPIRADRYRVS